MTDSEWESTPFPRFTRQQEAEIVAHSPAVDVAQALGIATTDQGDGTYRGVCPWCRSPSFSINVSSKDFACHSCAAHCRDVIVLTCKIQELWRADALQWLANRAGLTLREQRIADVSLAQVRLTADLIAVIRDSGREVSTSGVAPTTRCPLCRSARCEINTDRQQYSCTACGEGGDVITWVMADTQMSFLASVEHIAERYGISLTYEDAE